MNSNDEKTGSTFCGKDIGEMSKAELIEVINHLGQEVERHRIAAERERSVWRAAVASVGRRAA